MITKKGVKRGFSGLRIWNLRMKLYQKQEKPQVGGLLNILYIS